MTVDATARRHAEGHIQVTRYEPTPYDTPTDGGPTVSEINVTETFSGDIVGEGAARFLQTAADDGSASFVGVERVVGAIGDRAGTFVLQDQGTVADEQVTGSWFVVPGSGTGELTGLRGEGGFAAALGQNAVITLNYWFED